MKAQNILHSLVITCCILLVLANFCVAQNISEVNYTFDHQDPAGDVLKYNDTLSGDTVSEPECDPLDIKWINSEADDQGNLVLTMDLKSKNKFIENEETKYVFRIITNPENTTGYNITYKNHVATLVPFTSQGNGTAVDISASVVFVRDKGDEIMVITIPIAEYFENITSFWLDAYSMMITNNATYLDYISELPGHPEYVSPVVEDNEGLENTQDDSDDRNDNGMILILLLAIGSIITALVVLVILAIVAKRQRLNQH